MNESRYNAYDRGGANIPCILSARSKIESQSSHKHRRHRPNKRECLSRSRRRSGTCNRKSWTLLRPSVCSYTINNIKHLIWWKTLSLQHITAGFCYSPATWYRRWHGGQPWRCPGWGKRSYSPPHKARNPPQAPDRAHLSSPAVPQHLTATLLRIWFITTFCPQNYKFVKLIFHLMSSLVESSGAKFVASVLASGVVWSRLCRQDSPAHRDSDLPLLCTLLGTGFHNPSPTVYSYVVNTLCLQ